MRTTALCFVVGYGVRVWVFIKFNVWLVIGDVHIFTLLSVVIVTLPVCKSSALYRVGS